eukprot:GGOE01057253.1.p1 GENE.GGOE01057253.1~~GGOE01057253.1.p1  ORF type:complete len:530 (-),score=133.15 GGOE01057253.1:1333-2922(-)
MWQSLVLGDSLSAASPATSSKDTTPRDSLQRLDSCSSASSLGSGSFSPDGASPCSSWVLPPRGRPLRGHFISTSLSALTPVPKRCATPGASRGTTNTTGPSSVGTAAQPLVLSPEDQTCANDPPGITTTAPAGHPAFSSAARAVWPLPPGATTVLPTSTPNIAGTPSLQVTQPSPPPSSDTDSSDRSFEVLEGSQWDSPNQGKLVSGLEDFELLQLLGQGQYGKVWKVQYNGQVYAMKAIRKEEIERRNMASLLQWERGLLARIQHPFIANLKFAFQTQHRAFLVMDYIPGGEFGYHLRRDRRQFWEEDRVRLYAAQLVLALEYLHALGVVHRDVKSDNVLFDAEGHAVLIDVGLATRLPPGGMQRGSPAYRGVRNLYFSPEILRGEDFAFEADWWALGVLLFGLLMGTVPFPALDWDAMQQAIISDAEVEIPEARQLSFAGAHFLRTMLAKTKAKRLKTATAIKAHPWFQDVDWELVYRRQLPMPWVPPKEEDEAGLSLTRTVSLSCCGPPARRLDLEGFDFIGAGSS